MDDKKNKQTVPSATAQPHAPKTWGTTSAEFYTVLCDKPVQVTTLDSRVYPGILVGVDTYDLLLHQSSGAVLLIAKHAVKLVTVDSNGKRDGDGANISKG